MCSMMVIFFVGSVCKTYHSNHGSLDTKRNVRLVLNIVTQVMHSLTEKKDNICLAKTTKLNLVRNFFIILL